MNVSQVLRLAAVRIGKVTKSACTAEEIGTQICSILKDTLAPLIEQLAEGVPQQRHQERKNQLSHLNNQDSQGNQDIQEESPYMLYMAMKYLIDKGATETVQVFTDEIDTCSFMKEEGVEYVHYEIYNPWLEELSLPIKKNLYKRTNTEEKIEEIKEKTIAYLRQKEKEEEDAFPSAKKKMCLIVKEFADKKDQSSSVQEKKQIFRAAVDEIRKYFYFENESLIYVPHPESYCASILSVSSQEYQDILSYLSFLSSPLRKTKIERSIKEIRGKKDERKEIGIDILYFVGKKMEEINIDPYELESEPIESAAPPLFTFHSSFFCPVLRTECSIENFPCILVCGHVICAKAIEKMARLKGSSFKCPYCPKDVNVKDVFRLKLPI